MPTYKKKFLSESPNGLGIELNKLLVLDDLDTTFNPNANDIVLSITQQSDGKILLGGSFTSVSATTRNHIARLHENGALDTSFDPNANDTVYSIVQQSDGKILLGGRLTSVSGTTRNRIARVHENGDLDTSFDPNVSTSGVSFGGVGVISQQSDGKILLGGEFTSVSGMTRNYIARVHENGDLDTTFNPTLVLGPASGGRSIWLHAIEFQTDEKILVGGKIQSVNGTTRNGTARLHENGALDTSFNPNANNTVYSIVQQSDGKILLGGGFASVEGTTRNRIARLDTSLEEKVLHTTSDGLESLELFAASTSLSPAEREIIVYADEQAIGKFFVDDNSGAKKIFSIPPTFGAGVEITANRTSSDYTTTIFGHVNVQEDDA